MKQLIIFVVMALVVSSGVNAQSQKPVRGTHVIVTAPPGFVEADRFPGFLSDQTKSGITVTELPGPFAEVTSGFNESDFKKQGVILQSLVKTNYGTNNGLLISIAQSSQGVDFLKWMAVFGDEKTTYLVVASFPKKAEGQMSDPLKEAVLSARVSTTKIDPFGALTFRVTPTNDMKLANISGNLIMFNKGGVFPASFATNPAFIAGASTSKGLVIKDEKTFAEARMQNIAMLKDVKIKETKPITLDGLNGFESFADAIRNDSGDNMLAYQVMLFDADGYYLMQGLLPEKEGEAQLPTMKLMARSFKIKTAQP
jgi:hypothetical protein